MEPTAGALPYTGLHASPKHRSKWVCTPTSWKYKGCSYMHRLTFAILAPELMCRRKRWQTLARVSRQSNLTDLDPRFAQVDDDPRSFQGSPVGKAQRAALGERGLSGRNSASFDPKSTLVRPSMRISVGSRIKYNKELRHDDVVIVPDFFCAEDDWQVYYDLIQEMRELQEKNTHDSQWKSWHEGAHLLSPNPEGSKTYQAIVKRMCEYFSIAPGTRGTRFNWYRDGSDWKPFHHDSAAFNIKRARNQNCTVGISFGASRELAFRHAKSEELVYFPQTNGMLFFFGRDVNIRWQHGINALPESEQDGKGRISIILWGKAAKVIEESDSPAMLVDEDRQGKHRIRSRTPCRDFLRGNCRYGDKCKFAHVAAGAAGETGAACQNKSADPCHAACWISEHHDIE
eukprot:symbB.v1.2.004466.t1/scaffold249.1/size274694/25